MSNERPDIWELRDYDREFFERELSAFIPDRVFDAHAHLYDLAHFSPDSPHRKYLQGAPERAGIREFESFSQWLMPGRQVEALLLPFPLQRDIPAINRFVSDEVKKHPGHFAAMLVTPEMDPEYVRQEVRRNRLAGLKCYHIYSPSLPTMQAPIETYLPEQLMRVAHEEKLLVTLHMVRSRALADPANYNTIVRYSRSYPDARLILAHAARGFNPSHTIEGIVHLKGLHNVWFDTAAVNETGAFEAIVRTMGHDRLLYGSDFYVSHLRGRVVAIGDSFVWLTNWKDLPEARPTLVGLESLRCLKLASLHLGLTDTQIEAIFYANARALLG